MFSVVLTRKSLSQFVFSSVYLVSVAFGCFVSNASALSLRTGLTLDIVSIYLGRSGYDPKTRNLDLSFADKVAPELRANIAADQTASAVILLTEQADLRAAYSIKDHDARGWYVYNTLTQHAERSQAPLADILRREGVKYRPYWAANMIIADLDERTLELVSRRPDVARIDPNSPQPWIKLPKPEKSDGGRISALTLDGIEWGVTNVNAPSGWAMGYTGQGMVIGDLDTGIRWTHDALKPKYRGWNGSTADHNYNWFDAVHSGGGVCGPSAG